ncbi:MAG: hypothetical protein LBQ14_01850 [Treponema sp.]|jgi:hypothetical protein|nr:hypothetical protein [Treponema sp.]
MKAVVQVFYGSTDEWKNHPKPLYKGVWGVEVRPDKKRIIKIGDGERPWPLLPPLIDEDSQLGDLTALIDRVGVYIAQVQELEGQLNTLQAQISQAQEELAGQLQQFEQDKAELEQEIADAGLVDGKSIHRDEGGKLYSSGTAEIQTGNVQKIMDNDPGYDGPRMAVVDEDRHILAGMGLTATEGPVLGTAFISDETFENSAFLLLGRAGDDKNRIYLLKDKESPKTAENITQDDELLNRAEIQALIEQAISGGQA